VRVAVLLGGSSSEREVSLASGVQVARALREAGHEVACVDTASGPLDPAAEASIAERGVGSAPPEAGDAAPLGVASLAKLLALPQIAGADVVFPVLHGGAGEDGTLQAVLELSGLRFTGSGHLGCAVAMDKDLSKRLLRDAGVPTPEWILLVDPAGSGAPPHGRTPEPPVIVKPNREGSTVGLTLVRDPAGMSEALALAARHDREVLVERYVPGREVTVAVVADEALPVGEIVPEHEIFDYECKYQPGMARETFPADLPEAVARRIREAALTAHRALKLSGFSRVDFILDADGTPWCLEANALPGMTATSLVPKAGAAAGLGFPELCDRILRVAGPAGTGRPEPGLSTR